jgi:hypothetical protein
MHPRRVLGIVVVALGAGLAARAARAQEGPQLGRLLEAEKRPIAQAMAQAGARAGVNVNLDSLAQGSGNGANLVVGAIAGMERIPATALPRGVNAAFAYLDLPDGPGGVQPNLPAGFYTVRVSASAETIRAALKASGGVPPDTTSPEGRPSVPGAQVALVDAQGQVAAVIPGQLGVFSLTVPPGATKQRTLVEPIVGAQYIVVWVICPNGWAVCFRLSWIDFFTYFF